MGRIHVFLLTVAVIFVAYGLYSRAHRYDEQAVIPAAAIELEKAYFAGGCFWCTEADFEKLAGVTEVISGYTGGHLEQPTYLKVITETTGHREAVEIRYDPSKIAYETLVAYYFSHIDPTDPGGSFVDRGESYTSAIFYTSKNEKRVAEEELARQTQSGAYDKPIVTLLLPFEKFWPAEEYHQDYYKKNPVRYEYYRARSGRNEYLEQICTTRSQKGVPCINSVGSE